MRGVSDRAAPPRLLLDSADRAAHERWLPTGLFYGVTTNPTILRRSGLACDVGTVRALARAAFDLGAREVQAQGWGGTADLYRHTGEAIAAVDERMVVKLPATEPGLRAARALGLEGVRVTLTAVYASHQAVLARAIGAAYVAPYLGRIGDAGQDGMAVVGETLRICDGGPRVLVASIRNASEVAMLAARGADTFTLGPGVAEELLNEAATLEATAAFERDASA